MNKIKERISTYWFFIYILMCADYFMLFKVFYPKWKQKEMNSRFTVRIYMSWGKV